MSSGAIAGLTTADDFDDDLKIPLIALFMRDSLSAPMTIHSRALLFGSVALLWSCGDQQPSPDPTPSPSAALAPMTPVAAAIALGATPLAIDESGTPTLLFGGSA